MWTDNKLHSKMTYHCPCHHNWQDTNFSNHSSTFRDTIYYDSILHCESPNHKKFHEMVTESFPKLGGWYRLTIRVINMWMRHHLCLVDRFTIEINMYRGTNHDPKGLPIHLKCYPLSKDNCSNLNVWDINDKYDSEKPCGVLNLNEFKELDNNGGISLLFTNPEHISPDKYIGNKSLINIIEIVQEMWNSDEIPEQLVSRHGKLDNKFCLPHVII